MKVAKYSNKFLLVLYYYKICQFYFIRKKSQCVILCAKSQVEIYNWLVTVPVPPGGCRYWRCTGIIPGGKRVGPGIRPTCHSAGSCLSVLAWNLLHYYGAGLSRNLFIRFIKCADRTDHPISRFSVSAHTIRDLTLPLIIWRRIIPKRRVRTRRRRWTRRHTLLF